MSENTYTYHPGGTHEIASEFAGQRVLLVRVRPVGTLEMGDIATGPFSEEWVPEMVAALQEAQKIASREKPWEPYR